MYIYTYEANRALAAMAASVSEGRAIGALVRMCICIHIYIYIYIDS